MAGNEPYMCPQCKRFGIAWDARAKILMCYYASCRYVIRIENQREIPSSEVICAAIDADKTGKSIGKAVRSVMKSDKQWDDPEFDSTDWAHPAWWRGSEYGLWCAIHLVEKIINGKETGIGAMHEDGDKLRQMVLVLKRERDSLRCDVERLERELNSERNRRRHA